MDALDDLFAVDYMSISSWQAEHRPEA